MNKVILINVEPFTPNRDRMFHISDLIKDGFDVSVWDVSFYSKRGIDFPDVIITDYIHVFKSLKEIKRELEKIDIKNTFFIVQVPFTEKSIHLYKLLLKKKCFIACFDFYSNVLVVDNYHIAIDIFHNNIFKTIRDLSRKIKNYYNWRKSIFLWRNIKYDCYLCAKTGSEFTGHINHPDYNDFMFKKSEPYLNYPYLVFCDNYFPYHPDLKGLAEDIDGKKYQRQLSDFFDFIEDKTGLPVIIAAHPKAKYKGDEFGNRRIIKLKTNNLVSYSEGVIFHSSNSISYAIMANKKVLCITTDDYNKTDGAGLYIKNLCEYLNIPTYNLDDVKTTDIDFSTIDFDIRYKYIHSFLTSEETENKDNFTIIKETILKASSKF